METQVDFIPRQKTRMQIGALEVIQDLWFLGGDFSKNLSFWSRSLSFWSRSLWTSSFLEAEALASWLKTNRRNHHNEH